MVVKGTRILVVDDDADLALMVREVLEEEGYHVTTVHTGQEGLRVFSQDPFDLVIQDVHLPGGLSGYAACQTYKSVRDTVPVIMITGKFQSEQDEVLARSLGADGFLAKPFTRQQLLQEVIQGLQVRAERLGEWPVVTCGSCRARFTVRDAIPPGEAVPASCPNCGQVAQVAAHDLTWERPREYKGPQGAEARHILVVDDNEFFRQFLGDLLREAGHVVLEAKNGKEGLEFSQQMKPHLVVADLMLPEMDGISMCKRIQEDPQTAQVPIIIITAFQSDSSKQQAHEMGATYLAKPVKSEEFFETVDRLLSQ